MDEEKENPRTRKKHRTGDRAPLAGGTARRSSRLSRRADRGTGRPVLEKFDGEQLTVLFDCLDKEKAADAFVLLSRGTQKQLLKDFSDVKLQSVTDEIIDDDVEELLESMPTDVVHEVLLKATPENRNDKIVEIVDYLEEKKFSQLKPLLAELEPADLAEIFADLEEQDLPIVFRLLPKELAAVTFVEMNSSQQELLIKSFSDAELQTRAVRDDTSTSSRRCPQTWCGASCSMPTARRAKRSSTRS